MAATILRDFNGEVCTVANKRKHHRIGPIFFHFV
jgi:hypothetical protein